MSIEEVMQMFRRQGMTSYNIEAGSGPRFKIMKALGLLSFLFVFILIFSGFNIRNSSAAGECDCTPCHGANHHGDNWPLCSTCHGAPPATGSHLVHSAPLSNTTYGDTVTNTAGQYQFGCGHCHSLAVTTKANHEISRNAIIQLSGPTGLGQSGQQVCWDCHSSNGPHGTSCGTTDCLSCHSVAQGSYPAIVPATNHHSGACETCHYTGSADGRAPHDTIRPLTTNGSCAACHTESLALMKHPQQTGTPTECITCHDHPGAGVAPNVDLACGQCHGGSQGASATKNGAVYFDQATLAVYAAGIHAKLPPTVANTSLVSPVVKGSPVSFVDASTDNNHESIASIYVNWGDGQTQTGSAGATFTHIYTNAGNYNVIHTATDAGGRQASELIPVQVMVGSKTKITVTVTQSNGTTPISAARIYLKKAGVLTTTGYTNVSGVWVFSNLLPAADYTVEVYKSGVDFGKGTGKTGTAVSADTTTGDVALSIRAVTP